MNIITLLTGTGAKAWLSRRLVGFIVAGLTWLSGLAIFSEVSIDVPSMEWINSLATFVVSLVLALIHVGTSAASEKWFNKSEES